MNYVVLGGAGHISKPLTEKLLQLGHKVTVVSRNAGNLKELAGKGAKVAEGSVEDVAFLTSIFKGADAVYTMVPPNFGAPDMKEFIGFTGENYAVAIRNAGVKYVVNLSSIGAHMATGCGPVSGLFRVEQAFNKLEGVQVKHLRPAYFYQNFLANIGLIKHAGIIGSNFTINGKEMPVVDPSDIATVAVEELTKLDFKGSGIRYIASDEVSTGDIASAIGKAIGKPDLPWVEFSDDQALEGMKQAGLSENVAGNYVEMGQAIRNGEMYSEYSKTRPALASVKLDDFAAVFATAFNAA
ncbi:MAG: NmrA family NAD(P)-binding protein [Flavitalea sp.]